MGFMRRICHRFLLLLLLATSTAAQTAPYRFVRAGNTADQAGRPTAGFALMGGGTDLDEAFRWLCQRAGGGDFLVLRAHGDAEYNGYMRGLCPVNSVSTIVLPSRAAATEPFVADKIREASGIFIAGGDQSNYINFWMGTPVQAELNAAIARGVPIGGTSAGLAVLGEYAYSAQGDKPDDPNLDGKTALANPYGPRITLVHGFLDIPVLKGILTDTHFAKRNRMGRLLVFLARLNAESSGAGKVRGIGVEQRAAVLLEPDGHGSVIGHGSAYFVGRTNEPSVLESGKLLTGTTFIVQKVAPGHSFNLEEWSGNATTYTLRIENGAMHSTQTGGAIY